MAAPIRYADRVVLGADGAPAAKQFAPAADRNKEPIGDVLDGLLPPAGGTAARLVEVASGTGQHAAYLARRFAGRLASIQPTDVDPGALASIAAYAAEVGGGGGDGDAATTGPAPAATILPALAVDAGEPATHAALSAASAELVLCVNLLHISLPATVAGLAALAARVLVPGGRLVVYGPFTVGGAPTTDSNAAFHNKLRGMHPQYGLRDVDDVAAACAAHGLALARTVDMPSNNFALVFERRAAD
jgi:SAM-dependent methyltransferase